MKMLTPIQFFGQNSLYYNILISKRKYFIKVLILLLTLLFISKILYSQGNKDLNYNAPALFTPNIAALSKYFDFPVNKYNGIPDISIPVYTIKDGDIEIPIVLRYHGGGIKVSEESSWVGLGWSLDVGGSITRVIRGKDDHFQNTDWSGLEHHIWPTYNFNHVLKFNNEDLITDTPGLSELGFDELEPSGALSNYDLGIIDAIEKGEAMPDYYYLNGPGISGKFFYDFRNGKIYFEDPQNTIVKAITNNRGDESKFRVITDNGFNFYFEEDEYKWFGNTSGPREVSSETSFLTRIVTPSNQVALFSYHRGEEAVKKDFRGARRIELCDVGCISNEMISYNTSTYTPKYLDSIETPNFIVCFKRGDRDDIQNEKRLSRIIVKEKLSGNLRTFVFDNEDQYFYALDGADKRLKLASFYEEKEGVNPYIFSYNEEVKLPNKKSYATDYWGYYNGRNGNVTSMPNISKLAFYESFYRNLPRDYAGGANNNQGSDSYYMKACMLQQIEYPTGGYSNFYWEPNTFSNYLYEEACYPINSDPVEYKNSEPNSTKYFSINVPVNTSTVSVSYTITNGRCSEEGIEVSGEIRLNKKYGNNIFDKRIVTGEVEAYPKFIFEPTQSEYTLEVELGESCETDLDYHGAEVRVYITYVNRPVKKMTEGAGLRIKMIKQIENLSEPEKTIIKRYKYEYSKDGETYSYGKLQAPLKFFIREWHHHPENDPFDIPREAISVSSTNQVVELNRTSTSSVGYSKVIEYFGENEDAGSIAYQYINNDFPYEMYYTPSLGNGLETGRSYYNSNGKVLKSISNTYQEEYPYHSFYQAQARNFYRGPYREPVGLLSQSKFEHVHYPGELEITFIPMISQKMYLEETKETNYFLDESIQNISTTKYVYNSNWLVSEIHKSTGSKQYSTFYKRPTEYIPTTCSEEAIVNTEKYYTEKYSCDIALSENIEPYMNCVDQQDSIHSISYRKYALPYKQKYESCLEEYSHLSSGVQYLMCQSYNDRYFDEYAQCYQDFLINVEEECGPSPSSKHETCISNLVDVEAKLIECKTELKPAYSTDAATLLQMVDSNYSSAIIEELNYVGTNNNDLKLISSTFNKYRDVGDNACIYKPVEIYHLENETPISIESNNVVQLEGTSTVDFLLSNYLKKQGNLTYEPEHGNLIELQKKDDVKTSYLWGYNNTKPIAKVVNAESEEIFADGFEEGDYTSGWRNNHANQSLSDEDAYSGNRSWKIFSYGNCTPACYYALSKSIPISELNLNNKYVFSAMVKSEDVDNYINLSVTIHDVDGRHDPTAISYDASKEGQWQLLKVEVDLSEFSGITSISCIMRNVGNNNLPCFVDDVRFHPADAQMTSYTYEPMFGISSITDAQGKTTTYEYDGLGRLIRVRDHNGHILSENEYNYAQ